MLLFCWEGLTVSSEDGCMFLRQGQVPGLGEDLSAAVTVSEEGRDPLGPLETCRGSWVTCWHFKWTLTSQISSELVQIQGKNCCKRLLPAAADRK